MTDVFDYAETKADADELIAEFGQAATLRRPGASTGDAWNPTQGAATDYGCMVVVLSYDYREIDGTRILSTDKKVLLAKASLSAEPATSDRLLISGAEHAIIDVQPLNPGGTVVLYQIQARR